MSSIHAISPSQIPDNTSQIPKCCSPYHMVQHFQSQRIPPHDHGCRSDPRHHPNRTPAIDLHLPLILEEPPGPILPFDSFLPCHTDREHDGHGQRAEDGTGSGRARDNAGRREVGGPGAQGSHDSNGYSEHGARLEAAVEDMGGENEVRIRLIFRVRSVPLGGYHG
ncbi:hypothetical protein IFM60648_05994 [Aspergillus lentulus]|uniref:Uncharacterized protein n=1 Tax=Aspergillus lentulus TaxID=293939 RepID=A0ABQ1AG95_ASPLE|nr:hypothetical protein IFM60648_05994 [Aspergillus lentulus]